MFRVVWSFLPCGRSRSKRRDGFPPVCVVLCLISVRLCLSWSGREFWVGLDFSSGCLVAGQFGKTAGKFYPGGRKVFGPGFGCFLGFCVSCCLELVAAW